jgi:hypothetical protein
MKWQIAAILFVVCLVPASLAAQSMSPADAQAWREDLRFMAQAMEKTVEHGSGARRDPECSGR